MADADDSPAARAPVWALPVAGLALTLGVLGLAAMHVEALGARALVDCDAALAAGDGVGAISLAREAAMARVGFGLGGASEQGFARLASIAEAAEARGDFEQATVAWRATRVAARAPRREEPARMAESARALVRLATRACEGKQTRAPAACAAATEASLAADDLPSTTHFDWVALGAVAFLGGGAAALSAKGRAAQRLLAAVAVVGAVIVLASAAVR